MTPIRIGLGFVGMFTILITFAMTRMPASVTTAKAEVRFDDSWNDIMNPLKFAALKAEIEKPVVIEPKPRTVTTERVILAVPAVLPDEEVSAPPVRQRVKRVQQRGDVCTRHRMHKVVTRGGKSWRCRK